MIRRQPTDGNRLPKRFRRWVLAAATLILFSGYAHAGTRQGGSPADRPGASPAPVTASTQWPWQHSDLKPDPAAVFGRLPNGFRYVIYPNHNPAERVSMHLYVDAGSLNEQAGQQGIAHFLEHMMFNGTTHFPPGELVKFFQRIGMQFGPDANAHTGFSETVYDVLLPGNGLEAIREGLQVLKDYADGALLLPSEVDRERPVILAEKRTRDSAAYRSFVKTLAFEFPDALVSRRLPIGDATVLHRADAALLRTFYDAWYRPDHMVLVLVGDLQPKDVAALIEKMFSTATARGPRTDAPPFGTIAHKGINAFYHREPEIGHTTVTIETLREVAPEPDTVARRYRELAAQVADRIVNHRLEAVLSEPDAPFTSAEAASGVFLRRIAYTEMTADCNSDQWADTLKVLEHTLRQALLYGFSQEALDRVKADIRSDLRQAVESASTRDSGEIARDIIHGLNERQVFLSPEQERALLAPELDRLTPQQVHEAFKRSWAAGHRLVLVTGDVALNPAAGAPESQILTAFMQSRSMKVTAPEAGARPVFPYLKTPEGAAPGTRRDIEDLGVVQVDFGNGFRLNLKKTDFSAGRLEARLGFGNGRLDEPPALSGLSLFAQDLVNESGLGALDKEALARSLAGRQTRVWFSVDEDRFAFNAQSVPDELPLLFQLLYAHVRDPAFRESVQPLLAARYRQRYQQMESTVGGALRIGGWRWLAGGDGRFGMPAPSAYGGFTASQVKKWIEGALHHSPLELTLVGDFNVAEAIQLAGRYLGGLPVADVDHSTVNRQRGPRFPAGQEKTLAVNTRIQNALLVLAFPSSDLWDIRTTRRLAVLADVISDRMRLRIREALGATYAAYAVNRPSRAYDGYGMLACFVQVDPKRTEDILAELKHIVTDIRQNGISEDELRRAIDPTLTSLKDLRQKNEYWLGTVLSGSSRHPEQLDWSRSIVSDYAGIGVRDVEAVAERYLDPAAAAVLRVRPQTADER